MGASLGVDDKKSVNIELNIVPFIDLMSCLTAFLLVTAAWVNIASLNIRPKGISREQTQKMDENEDVICSVLVSSEVIWIGLSRVEDGFTKIEKSKNCKSDDKPDAQGRCHDWDRFREELKKLKTERTYFKDREDIEIAAESSAAAPVKYQDIIFAMDIAVQTGFEDVGLTDPQGLSAPPSRQ
jgi:biopolymer transport protein ExbD